MPNKGMKEMKTTERETMTFSYSVINNGQRTKLTRKQENGEKHPSNDKMNKANQV